MPTEIEQMAAELLTAIWRGVPAAYKSRYRTSIWRQFEDNIRAAAYTSSLARFTDTLCAKLGAQISSGYVASVEGILNSGQDRALLKSLREEATLLVLMVRVANQERQEQWKVKQAELEAEESAMADPRFGLPEGEER